MKFFA